MLYEPELTVDQMKQQISKDLNEMLKDKDIDQLQSFRNKVEYQFVDLRAALNNDMSIGTVHQKVQWYMCVSALDIAGDMIVQKMINMQDDPVNSD